MNQKHFETNKDTNEREKPYHFFPTIIKRVARKSIDGPSVPLVWQEKIGTV